jgi:hypothetical protein
MSISVRKSGENEVIIVVTEKIIVFRNVTPYSLVEIPTFQMSLLPPSSAN